MGTSVLHIKSEIECEVYLFDENKGVAKPCAFFNLEVRKGVQELLFISTEDENTRYKTEYMIENGDSDYRLFVEKFRFQCFSSDFLECLRIVEQGNVEVFIKLGDLYYKGKGVEQNYVKAIEYYKKAMLYSNDVEYDADYRMGECYYYGRGVEQDYNKAIGWYREAANDNNLRGGGKNVNAQYALGVCYERGHGVKQDYHEAVKWYKKAAERGHTKAQYAIGRCYYAGKGIEQNYLETVKWYKKVIERGKQEIQETIKAEIQYQLGNIYYYGKGVNQDYIEAIKLFRKAIEDYCGNEPSDLLCKIGDCYFYGRGIKRNHEEAIKYYQEAAECGNVDAQNKLDEILENI